MNSVSIKEAHTAMDTRKRPTRVVEAGVTVGREGPLEEATFQMRLDNFGVKINCIHCILLLQKAPLKSYERGFKKVNTQGYRE